MGGEEYIVIDYADNGRVRSFNRRNTGLFSCIFFYFFLNQINDWCDWLFWIAIVEAAKAKRAAEKQQKLEARIAELEAERANESEMSDDPDVDVVLDSDTEDDQDSTVFQSTGLANNSSRSECSYKNDNDGGAEQSPPKRKRAGRQSRHPDGGSNADAVFDFVDSCSGDDIETLPEKRKRVT